jgi:NOL1/NOP2/fmu family ribosome biogenesis protein
MAKIIEREDTQASTEDVFAEQEQLEVEEQVTPSEPDIPDKYQNKSAQELVQMHQEAEKLLGRQSSEVGELRKVVDNYIQAQLTTEPQQQQEKVEEVDFFTDPEKAVAQAIQNHPKIKEAESVSQQYRMQTALSALKTNHPDMESILQDTKFAEWIQGSKVRTKLFVAADKEYDYEAADELFNLWKERQQMIGQAANAEKQSRKQAVRTASTGNASGSSESSPKKIYRRADIIKLMKEDPHRYAALQDEIMRAYAEKRVK